MNYTTRGAIRVGEILTIEQDADGRQYLTPADPTRRKPQHVGVAACDLPDGTEIEAREHPEYRFAGYAGDALAVVARAHANYAPRPPAQTT